LKFRAIAQNGAARDSRAGMAAPARTGALDEQPILLSTLPPSRGQKRLALAIVLLLLAAFCATVPFAAVPVGYIREFIPAYAAAMFVISSNAARVYFLVSSTLVLAVLLSETALLYARLARSVMAQRREREARLMTMDVLSASIAHEMNQPLASIVTNADAASRWMARPTPDLAK